MGAHIFLVGENNFDICVQLGVYGCVSPNAEWNKAEIIAGVLSIQEGDLVFFYVKNKGIYGLWKIVSEPFYDETQIWSNKEQLYPYRFLFEPTVGYFSKPIALSDVLDLHDKGRIWTFDLNPVQQKNQYKITMDEARELLRLLLRNNPIRLAPNPIPDPYIPLAKNKILLDLTSDQKGRFRYEGWLNAWFMHSLNQGELKQLLGEYCEYINLVPTTFNKVMDIFLTHVTRVDSIDVLHKYTCIELKNDHATEKDLTQVLRYEDWLARKLAGGDKDMIQSILVAGRFSDGVIEYVNKRRQIEEKSVRLLIYHVMADRNLVELEELLA